MIYVFVWLTSLNMTLSRSKGLRASSKFRIGRKRSASHLYCLHFSSVLILFHQDNEHVGIPSILFKNLKAFVYLAAPGLSCGMWNHSCSMWDLVPWSGIDPRPPALGVWSLSNRTTREVPPVSSYLRSSPWVICSSIQLSKYLLHLWGKDMLLCVNNRRGKHFRNLSSIDCCRIHNFCMRKIAVCNEKCIPSSIQIHSHPFSLPWLGKLASYSLWSNSIDTSKCKRKIHLPQLLWYLFEMLIGWHVSNQPIVHTNPILP